MKASKELRPELESSSSEHDDEDLSDNESSGASASGDSVDDSKAKPRSNPNKKVKRQDKHA